jgi:hypothetical protein
MESAPRKYRPRGAHFSRAARWLFSHPAGNYTCSSDDQQISVAARRPGAGIPDEFPTDNTIQTAQTLFRPPQSQPDNAFSLRQAARALSIYRVPLRAAIGEVGRRHGGFPPRKRKMWMPRVLCTRGIHKRLGYIVIARHGGDTPGNPQGGNTAGGRSCKRGGRSHYGFASEGIRISPDTLMDNIHLIYLDNIRVR